MLSQSGTHLPQKAISETLENEIQDFVPFLKITKQMAIFQYTKKDPKKKASDS